MQGFLTEVLRGTFAWLYRPKGSPISGVITLRQARAVLRHDCGWTNKHPAPAGIDAAV